MKYINIKLNVLLLVLGLTGLQSQEATTTSGGDASGSGGSVAFSIGQLVYTTNTGSMGTLAQGVQQQYEITPIGIDEETASKISMSVFPNPTAGIISLQVHDISFEMMNYQIFDVQGKLLDSKSITTNLTQINMDDLPTTTYFIHVTQQNKKIQSFKIIKN